MSRQVNTPEAGSPAPTIQDLLRHATDVLKATSESARLDAELLLAECLGVSRTHLYTWPERQVDAPARARLDALMAERRRGRPIAQILGRQGFHSLELTVTDATLIPRPETELIVDLALEMLQGTNRPRVLDLGAGSGAIAVAVAHHRPDALVDAVELSDRAAAVARQNAARHGLSNLHVHTGSWFEPVGGTRYEAIVANPPYVAESERALTSPGTRHEPREALYAAEDGLAALRAICAAAPGHLQPGGWLILEHGFRQGGAVRGLLQAAGFEDIASHRDLAGHDRATRGRHPWAAEEPEA
ncbi:peptide chain release factor N(5)-glutamine methyltransferase [Ectothiorhodospiraceae bacterium WFHF3C12]|nr:peptide chain release factor N(5)-glutamine methyltransferase [Ectothiorhodospiraceae bacterium WFHF3C12]